MKTRFFYGVLFTSIVALASCGGNDDEENTNFQTDEYGEENFENFDYEWRITQITTTQEALSLSESNQHVYDIQYDSQGRVLKWLSDGGSESVAFEWGDTGLELISDESPKYVIENQLITKQQFLGRTLTFTHNDGYKTKESYSGAGLNDWYEYTWEGGLLTAYRYGYRDDVSGGVHNFTIEYGEKIWPEKSVGPFFSEVPDIDGLNGKHPFLLPEKKIKVESSPSPKGGITRYYLSTQYDYSYNEKGQLVEWRETNFNNGDITSKMTYSLVWNEVKVYK